MIKRILFVAGLFITWGVCAQKSEFSGYNWNSFPPVRICDTIKTVNGSMITLERRITEVSLNDEDVFEEIYVFHRKIRVETHDAINNFNKIYVPVGSVVEVIAVKARFISKNGKITEVPSESIRQVENLEKRGDFQTFAIEGAETGGEIEYYFTLRRRFNPYGSVVLQGSEPRAYTEIIHVYPQALEFLFKSYNNMPGFTASEDSATGRKYQKVQVISVPALTEENYSAYHAQLMWYEYTLTHNGYAGVLRIYSFSKVAGNMYNNVYLTTKSEVEAVKNALKKIPVEGKPLFEKIRTVENWLKSEMVVTEELPGTPPIDEMLRVKQTTELGMTRLLIAFLNQMNIKFETVMTCDRSQRRFDPDFNGWNFLDDFLIYIPELNAAILPENPSYRLGLIPSNYQDTYGLFMHPVSLNNLTTLGYEVKKLPADNFLNNTDSLYIKLKLDLDEMNLDADIHRAFSGELASNFQSFWKLLPAERKTEMIKSLFDMGNQNTTIENFDVSNSLPEDIGVKPMLWNVRLTANSLVEQAGEDILVKIGESIGAQSELYQQSERKLPVYTGSLHSYFRKIEFEIPQGYVISNPGDLLMKVEMLHNNRVSCGFTSDYEIKGNKLTVYSREFYSELEYPLEEFESFRKVINAAADFNKKTILLTRK